MYGKLPFTGAAISLGGIVFDQLWVAAVGVALVTAGAVIIRLTWRRDRGPDQS